MVGIQLDGVRERFSGQGLTKAQKLGAEQAADLMTAKYVPMSIGSKQGNLRATVNVTDAGRIQYTSKYAKAQFYGTNGRVQFKNYSTPGTSRRWDLRMKSNKQDMAAVKRAAAREVLR